jgi:hypothetical protein
VLGTRATEPQSRTQDDFDKRLALIKFFEPFFSHQVELCTVLCLSHCRVIHNPPHPRHSFTHVLASVTHKALTKISSSRNTTDHPSMPWVAK